MQTLIAWKIVSIVSKNLRIYLLHQWTTLWNVCFPIKCCLNTGIVTEHKYSNVSQLNWNTYPSKYAFNWFVPLLYTYQSLTSYSPWWGLGNFWCNQVSNWVVLGILHTALVGISRNGSFSRVHFNYSARCSYVVGYYSCIQSKHLLVGLWSFDQSKTFTKNYNSFRGNFLSYYYKYLFRFH